MRSLILVRHGKSDWDAGLASDHARPLRPRGRKAAQRIGRLLTDAGLVPDAVWTSTARRALDTAELAAQAGCWEAGVEATDALYDTDVEDALDLLRAAPGDVLTLAVFGHEPTWSALASALIGGGALRVVTGAAVGLEVVARDWRGLAPGSCELRFLVPPRMLS